MAYRTTARADADLIAIYLHGAGEFGRDQAERYHASLVRRFEVISANPLLARERKELTPPIRLLPHRAHLIAYIVVGGDVLIVRILHGRQDWENLL